MTSRPSCLELLDRDRALENDSLPWSRCGTLMQFYGVENQEVGNTPSHAGFKEKEKERVLRARTDDATLGGSGGKR